MSYVIIGVHGLRNKPLETAHAAAWEAAIREGLQRNLGSNVATLNFQLVYWANDLYPQPDLNDGEPYLPATGDGPLRTYKDGWITDVVAEVIGAGGTALDIAKRWLGLADVTDQFLTTRLQDLAQYYSNAEIRTRLRDKLRTRLLAARGQRILLVAHSMGSIIAYDTLREIGKAEPSFEVEHFVTIGSPLGFPHVKLKIHEENHLVRTPTVVRRWTNQADRRDPIAIDTHLADDYKPNDRDVTVQDDLVINGYVSPTGRANHHKIYGYLRTPEFSELVSEFIGR